MNKHRHFVLVWNLEHVEWFHGLFLCQYFDDTALCAEKYNRNFQDLTAIIASNILKMTGQVFSDMHIIHSLLCMV